MAKLSAVLLFIALQNAIAIILSGKVTQSLVSSIYKPGIEETTAEELVQLGGYNDCQRVVVDTSARGNFSMTRRAIRLPSVLFSKTLKKSYTLPHANCHVIFITDSENSNVDLQTVELLKIRLHPSALVIFFGKNFSQIESLLLSRQLGNNINLFYLLSNDDGSLSIFRRCLFCGELASPSVRKLVKIASNVSLIHKLNLFPDEMVDMKGRLMKIVGMEWPPYIAYSKRTPAKGGDIVTPSKSLDLEMLTAISHHLNFTYVMRTPVDNVWGIDIGNGTWSGIVRTLIMEEADMSTMLSWTRDRRNVMQYSRIYAQEPLVPVIKKVQSQPEYLALVKPFPGWVWILFCSSCVIFGLMLALASLATSSNKNYKKKYSTGDFILQSWAILFENSFPIVIQNSTVEVMFVVWFIYTMLITTCYKSSLVAYLSVPGKTKTLSTLEEVAETDEWTFGYEPTYGSGWAWLTQNENPSIKKVAKKVQVLPLEQNMEMVFAGKHLFLSWKYYITRIIRAQYTDSRGYTPFYISKAEYFNYGGYGWGFRTGSPFREVIDLNIQHLYQTGLINYWLNNLLDDKSENNGVAKQNVDMTSGQNQNTDQVILSLRHLQVSFYLLLFGCVLATCAFIIELCLGSRKKSM